MFGRKFGGKAKLSMIRIPSFLTRLSFPEIHIPTFDTVLGFILNFNFQKNKRRIIIALSAGAFIFMVFIVADFMKVRALAEYTPETTTKLYDKNGILISELFRQKRDVVPYSNMPKNLVNAFVAMEDNDFYDHIGINPKAIVRAMLVNISSFSIKQGGSTITQQLAKVLMTSGKRTIFRKVKDVFLALMIEAFYDKDKIMELYLNQIFLGHDTYGVEAASQLYFKKHVKDLNLAECALLSTLPSAPNLHSPIKNIKRSRQMHIIALAKMADLGYITVKEAEDAYNEFWPEYSYEISDVSPSISSWSERIDKAPWFTEYVRRQLLKEMSEEELYSGGLSVYTTLDLSKQLAANEVMESALRQQNAVSTNLLFFKEDVITEQFAAEAEMFTLLFDLNSISNKGSLEGKKINDAFKQDALDEIEIINFFLGSDNMGETFSEYKFNNFQDKDFLKVQGALISVNQSNGYIEAMIGGSTFERQNQLNRAVQSYRQPGSSIKPLLYAAAFEKGDFSPASSFFDSPAFYMDNEGGDWTPENYEGGYNGMMTLRRALAMSINVISVKLAESIGIQNVMDYYASFFGMDKQSAKRRIPRNFSIALGSIDVTPLEITCAYGAIANGGMEVLPFGIRYIKDRDKKIIKDYESEMKKKNEKRRRIIEPATSQIMISMLQSTINSGTGAGAYPGRPACGKTGTTSGWRDAWFVGFTPEVTTAIWFGYDTQGISLGVGQTGGGIAAPTWGRYMRQALSRYPVTGFPEFAGLESMEVCAFSGMKPTADCKEIIKEVFIPGKTPKEDCKFCADRNNGYNLNIKGPKESIVEKNKNEINSGIKSLKGDKILDNIGEDLLK